MCVCLCCLTANLTLSLIMLTSAWPMQVIADACRDDVAQLQQLPGCLVSALDKSPVPELCTACTVLAANLLRAQPSVGSSADDGLVPGFAVLLNQVCGFACGQQAAKGSSERTRSVQNAGAAEQLLSQLETLPAGDASERGESVTILLSARVLACVQQSVYMQGQSGMSYAAWPDNVVNMV